MLIVGIVAFLLFGSKLPSMARSLGAAIPAFKAGLRDIENEIKDTTNEVKK